MLAAQITRKNDSALGLAIASIPVPAYGVLVDWQGIAFDKPTSAMYLRFPERCGPVKRKKQAWDCDSPALFTGRKA